jgi:dTDP-4-amino-4,6-dideoxygalactose transaminase
VIAASLEDLLLAMTGWGATVLGYDDCVVAKDIYRRAIMLPMYKGIEEGTLERVAKTLNSLVH